MADACDAVTSFRWKFLKFKEQEIKARSRNRTIFTSSFALERSSAKFALFYKPIGCWSTDKFGIILKGTGDIQQMRLDIEIWFENEKRKKFGKRSAQRLIFKDVGDNCTFEGYPDNDYTLINDIYVESKLLFICCKITHSKVPIMLSSAKIKREILQNQWALYEEGIHDSIIKIGDSEFKVLKSHLMAQSSVFKSMFLSKFKEGQTSTIDVKDVNEQTMKQLIKWMYLGQVDDENEVESLFEAADKYDVKLLKDSCVQLMIATLDNLNAFERLILAVMHNEDALKNACLDRVAKMSKDELSKCYASAEWSELTRKCPRVVEEVSKLINK